MAACITSTGTLRGCYQRGNFQLSYSFVFLCPVANTWCLQQLFLPPSSGKQPRALAIGWVILGDSWALWSAIHWVVLRFSFNSLWLLLVYGKISFLKYIWDRKIHYSYTSLGLLGHLLIISSPTYVFKQIKSKITQLRRAVDRILMRVETPEF